MRALGTMKKAAREFEKSGTLYCSEKAGPPGALYRVGNDERLERRVGEFEKEFGASVYHVVPTNCEFGRVCSFPYVGDEEDGGDWEAEREMLAHGQRPAWCENRDEPMFSEFGYVGARSAAGGLDRTRRR